MKLYTFDSCPFCTRVKAFAGLKNIDLEIVTFPLGELASDVASKLEKFSVPILEFSATEKSETQVMTESLDILSFLDGLSVLGSIQPMFSNYQISKQAEQVLSELRPITAPLLYPRMTKADLPELATAKAMDIFVQSREEYLGAPLETFLSATEEYLPELEAKLIEIVNDFDLNSLVKSSRKLTIDDIVLFADLRNLTLIGELAMPKLLQEYLAFIAEKTKVNLYSPIYA